MKAFFYALVIFRIVHLHMAYFEKEEWFTRIITLKQGDIRGKVVRMKKSTLLQEVEVYLGIPYAAPPVNSLRFMPPGAPPRWSETLNAFNMKPACPQMFPDLDHTATSTSKLSPERNIFIRKLKQFVKSESEDCLYLNIYVPHEPDYEDKKKKNYPVILFIHGESFEWNSGNLYDGSVIASYGEVIFVTINFRLGIFGFLKQGLMAGRANYGLSDQIAALQWIKGNIAEFGGDTSRVTVMGHDTGAACVNFLMLSPVAEGLFHRAILMAGSALSPWALTETPLQYIQLAEELNCSLENNTNCFQRRRKEDIISSFKKFEMLPFESSFTPVVDEVVVLNSPAEHMEKYSSLFSKYDLLAGFNEVESYYLIKEEESLKLGILFNEGQKYLDTYIRTIFKKSPELALQKTLEKYLVPVKDSPIRIRNAVLDALSDMLVKAPLLHTLHYHAVTPKNTFFYVFGHHTASENHLKINNKSIYGDDLPYALGIPLNGPSYHYTSDYNAREEQLSETVLRYFTNFAKTGDPNAPNNQLLFTFTSHGEFRQNAQRWPPFRPERQPFMHLEIPTEVRYRYREEYDQFWNLSSFTENYDGTSYDVSNSNNTVEDDGGRPTGYEFSTSESNNHNSYNNFYKINNPNLLQKGAVIPVDGTESTSTVVIIVIVLGVIFLILNTIVFIFLYYQRGKMRVRENLFRNRFRCRTLSVPDIFETNDAGEDIYAIATSVAGKEKELRPREGTSMKVTFNNWKEKAVNKLTGKEKRKHESVDYDYDTIRVASVKPEAISGKRMKRWPLSRQCSGSTITVDAHSKVRNWIAQEISSRRQNNKNRKTKEPGTSTNPKAEEKRKVHDKRGVRKVSIAIDATPAARTGSVLKQIPIEFTKSLDNGKNPLINQMRTSSSMSCIRNKPLQRSDAFLSEDSEEYYQRTGTHKSSAHIRLRTPEFVLEGKNFSPQVSHIHSRSDPSPMDRIDLQDAPIYSRVNKDAKRLKSFADSASKIDSFESTCDSTNTDCHYEDMDGRETMPHPGCLTNRMRRNFPKVLPDFPQTELRANKRLSLPPCGSIQLVDCCSSRSARIPPAPPPRLHSTMKRNFTPGRSFDSCSSDKQLSQITVQLKKISELPPDDEQKRVDIIQTEGFRDSQKELDKSTSEKIELNDLRKRELILSTTIEAESDYIPILEASVQSDDEESTAQL